MNNRPQPLLPAHDLSARRASSPNLVSRMFGGLFGFIIRPLRNVFTAVSNITLWIGICPGFLHPRLIVGGDNIIESSLLALAALGFRLLVLPLILLFGAIATAGVLVYSPFIGLIEGFKNGLHSTLSTIWNDVAAVPRRVYDIFRLFIFRFRTRENNEEIATNLVRSDIAAQGKKFLKNLNELAASSQKLEFLSKIEEETLNTSKKQDDKEALQQYRVLLESRACLIDATNLNEIRDPVTIEYRRNVVGGARTHFFVHELRAFIDYVGQCVVGKKKPSILGLGRLAYDIENLKMNREKNTIENTQDGRDGQTRIYRGIDDLTYQALTVSLADLRARLQRINNLANVIENENGMPESVSLSSDELANSQQNRSAVPAAISSDLTSEPAQTKKEKIYLAYLKRAGKFPSAPVQNANQQDNISSKTASLNSLNMPD